MTTTPTITPTTPQELLLEEHLFAIDSLRGAIATMAMCRPEPCDYQNAEPDAFAIAMNAHHSRMARLETIMAELECIVELLQEQCERTPQ